MEGYTLLEYIESDGTQYIDTGFKPNQDTKVVLDFYSSGASSYKCVCGARIKNGDDCFAFWIKDDIAHPQIADNLYNKYSFNVSTKQRIIYIIDKNVATFRTSSVTMDSSTFQSQYNLYLFNCNQAGTAASNYFIRGKLYSCQIYDNDTLIRDYVPCMDNNGVYGLYDKVNGVFYASATDSGFTGKWAENKTLNVSMSEYRHRMMNLIPKTGLPKGYFRCEYIESDGTQYIDTGFKPNQDTRVVMDCILNTGNTYPTAFGTVDSTGTAKYTLLALNSSQIRHYYGNKETDYNYSLLGVRHLIDMDKEVLTIDNNRILTGAASTFSCKNNLLLLSYDGGVTFTSYGKIYSCQIYDNGVKVRDYVPCVSPEGYFGLYDLVTDEFYGFVQQKTARSYTVNLGLEGNWTKGGFTNPDSSKYDAYMSSSSKGVGNGYDIMRITITGYDEFTCYIRSYAETIYDYTVIGDLDTELTYSKVPGNVGVKAHTQGIQKSGTDIDSYTKVVYTGIGGGTHFIDVMYRKDGSGNSNDDRGYLLIDKSTVSSGGTVQVIGRGKVILPGGYTNAEYIASDGNQWIDTGHRPMSENLRVVLDFEYTASYSNKSLYGSQKASSQVFSILPHSGFFLVGSSGSNLLSTSYAVGTRYLLDAHADNGNFSVSLDGSLRTTTYTKPLYKDNTLYLFASHNGTRAAEMSSLKMYFSQIHDNGTFTKFFIPCSKDGVFGLYEMFEGIFYSSEGSSEFTGESDGDNEGSGGDDVVTISFTINGVSYQAEEGMTWEQWVNSSYNADGFIVDGNNIYKGSSQVCIDRGNYTDIVQKSDIIEGLSYELS